jgi:hypothetical protein
MMVFDLVSMPIENLLLHHVSMFDKEYLVQNYNPMVIVVPLLMDVYLLLLILLVEEL